MVGDLQTQIKQPRPFRSPEEAAFLNVLRTASALLAEFADMLRPHGLSQPQYNVLRILRGAGTAGMPTLTIRERMIEEGASITRLLDKLEEAGYARRERCRPDRRQVIAYLTDAGGELLARMDEPVLAASARIMEVLDPGTLAQFTALLDTVRSGARAAEAES